MNITNEVKLITPRVKDYRGYSDVIFDMTIFIDFTDSNTGSSIGYQILHKFDTETEYTEESPFVSFNEITENQINLLIETLITNEMIGGQIHLNEWISQKFEELYLTPVPKSFTFQVISESIGIGTSP